MAFNKVILIGNMVADPELKQTPTGVSVVSFTIAVQRRFAKPDDAQQADFINIVAWRQTAEFVSRYFTKGRSILVCGAIQTRSYTDSTTGQKRYITEVVADEVEFISTNRASGDSEGFAPAAAPKATSPVGLEPIDDDSLPF